MFFHSTVYRKVSSPLETLFLTLHPWTTKYDIIGDESPSKKVRLRSVGYTVFVNKCDTDIFMTNFDPLIWSFILETDEREYNSNSKNNVF